MSENGDITNSRALHDLAEKLFWALEYIDVNGSEIRGANMKCEIVDDVLEFNVNYSHFIERIVHRDPMQSLDINEGVKDGN